MVADNNILWKAIPFLDKVQVAALLIWLIRTEKDEVATAELKELLERHPMDFVYNELAWEPSAEAKKKQQVRAQESAEIESEVAAFVACLITLKGEGVSERASVSTWNVRWQKRAEDVKLEGEIAPDAESETDMEIFHPFGLNVLSHLRHLAHLYYITGDFIDALYRTRFYLDCVSDLVTEAIKDDATREDFLWGAVILSCMLVTPGKPVPGFDLSVVPQYIFQLNTTLEAKLSNKNARGTRDVFHQQCCLIHSAIWMLLRFHLPNAATISSKAGSAWNELMDWLFAERTQQCVLATAPHLLKYCAVIAIISRKKSDHLKVVINSIELGKHKYADAFTRFITAMFADYDFDAGQQEMAAFSQLCETDFFLTRIADQIQAQSRLLVFDNYGRIHKSLDIGMISEKLHMNKESAEQWVVTLIRDARLDAKIDSEKGVMNITSKITDVNANILEKLTYMLYRSQTITQNLERASISGKPSSTHPKAMQS